MAAKDAPLKLDCSPGSCQELWGRMAQQKPLVQCITNFVSMDIMANVLLAAGASPAMAHSLDEVEDFVAIASALLVNMGTLSTDWIAAKKLAARRAVELGKPWVLDPVGCGATPARTKACADLLKCKPTVVRGNGSEILALAGAAGNVKGVDSTASSSSALQQAKQLARDYGCIVAVSGEVDYVTDGYKVVSVHNGVPMLTAITAAGCAVTALIAALVTAAPHDPLMATAHALAFFGSCAQMNSMCGMRIEGPASLRVALIDELYNRRNEAFACVDVRVVEEGGRQ